MRNNREYQICKDIAHYLRLQYPDILYHFDLAGLNLSRAQAGMMKAIQGGRGWPDLFIAKPRSGYHGLFIEVKIEGTKLFKKDLTPATPHIGEQCDMRVELAERYYKATFAVGFDEAKRIIDDYLK
jgi:hypothetical protein